VAFRCQAQFGRGAPFNFRTGGTLSDDVLVLVVSAPFASRADEPHGAPSPIPGLGAPAAAEGGSLVKLPGLEDVGEPGFVALHRDDLVHDEIERKNYLHNGANTQSPGGTVVLLVFFTLTMIGT
jgi:hypothetical protein